jgi:phosphoribosylglycinamide formyltransferase 2
MRGDRPMAIVEEFIRFDSEITLLTVAAADGIHFCPPVGHRQEGGDYRESWQPAALSPAVLEDAQRQAATIVRALGGRGLFGVEFFIAKDRAIFSELSPRPHDTGMVTLIGQEPNEFELHLRAILGLPLGSIDQQGSSASAVILADRPSRAFRFTGVAEALATATAETRIDLRLFGKPETLAGRRMGVALARAATIDAAVQAAKAAAGAVTIAYEEES